MLDEVLNISLQTKVELLPVEFTDDACASDDRLVQAVLAGEQTAFADIFERYKRSVTGTVVRFFREHSDIEEFVQESFTKAFFSLKKYRGGEERSFAAWMTRITINVCYDEFRRRKRRGEDLQSVVDSQDKDLLESIADGRSRSPEQMVVAEQLVAKLLDGLSPEDRVAMTMVYSDECSLDETAKKIGITTSSLKSRLFRCRNHIRNRFGYLFSA
ncbi:MAG: RNA polymerase sigma factor [Pyrinomonadaceae bacterium]